MTRMIVTALGLIFMFLAAYSIALLFIGSYLARVGLQ